jgi:hypothetical protein
MKNTLLPLGRPAAIWGGSALLAHYGLHLAHGLQTGQVLWDAMHTPLGRMDGPLFATAFAGIDLALLGGVYAGLRGHGGPVAKWLGRAGAAFAGLALLATIVGLAGFLAGRMIPFAFPVACLSMFAGALLLGIAALCARTLPPWAALTLIAFALGTAPLGFTLFALMKSVPAYVYFELHFVPAGLAWLALASVLRAGNNNRVFPAAERYSTRAMASASGAQDGMDAGDGATRVQPARTAS